MLQNRLRTFSALVSLAFLAGCGASQTVGHQLFGIGGGTSSATPTAFGYAVADEPQATLVGRKILNEGGNAVDAAVAEGLAQAVTLPSRGSLGGGGACLIQMPNSNGQMQPPVMLSFPASAPATSTGSRPAAVPMLARGLLAMQARYGALSQSEVIVPAERLAGGAQMTAALRSDIEVVGAALLADPQANAIFTANGAVLPVGAVFQQPNLATTLENIRVNGVNGLYAGSYATSFVAGANDAGAGLTTADLINATPHYGKPDMSTQNGYRIASLPTTPAVATIPLPASASFMALDQHGGAVICVTSMNNLFGTGRFATGTGILLAASPKTHPVPQLAGAIADTTHGDFRAAVTGTGQNEAQTAATIGMANALTGQNTAIPAPGQANVISCPGGVPGNEASCRAHVAPNSNGLALGGR